MVSTFQKDIITHIKTTAIRLQEHLSKISQNNNHINKFVKSLKYAYKANQIGLKTAGIPILKTVKTYE